MHLTSSRFFGGPERQMLGLARALRGRVETIFCSFSESNLNQQFLSIVNQDGFTAIGLQNDTPHLVSACRELRQLILAHDVDVLICHGYKAGIVGSFARKNAGVATVAVSRGWTGENWKVRVYEALDKVALRGMQKVICVSRAQAEKVRRLGVRAERIQVIHNSIDDNRFNDQDCLERQRLLEKFPATSRVRVKRIVGAAGRLSPEKGFDVLVEAAARVIASDEQVGFVHFGNGPMKQELTERIETLGIADRFVLAGFTDELDRFMPNFDLFVQSSHTEGLPNVLLEALAAQVAVVATDVGGTREVLDDGNYGQLVQAGRPAELAKAILDRLSSDTSSQVLSGRQWVANQFTFGRQADEYFDLFASITGHRLAGASA